MLFDAEPDASIVTQTANGARAKITKRSVTGWAIQLGYNVLF